MCGPGRVASARDGRALNAVERALASRNARQASQSVETAACVITREIDLYEIDRLRAVVGRSDARRDEAAA